MVDVYLSSLSPKPTAESELGVLNLLSNLNSTGQLLESLYGQIDSFNYDQNNFNYYQRQYQKEQSKIQQWKQQRKLENLERAKRGEKELDTDEWKPFSNYQLNHQDITIFYTVVLLMFYLTTF